MNHSFLQNPHIIKQIFFETCQSRKHRFNLILALGLLGAGIYVNVFVPIIFKEIIDRLTLQDTHLFGFILLGYGILWTIAQAFVHLRELLMNSVIERSTRILGTYAFSHLYKLPHQFYLDKKTGELTNIMRRAQRSLPIILWATILHIIPVFLELVAVLIILFKSYSPVNILILLLTLILFTAYTLFATNRAIKQRSLSIEADKEADSKIIDWLLNLELVRTYGKTDYALQDYKNSLKKREKLEVKFLNTSGVIRIGQTIILGVGLSVLTYCLGNAVKLNEMTIGDFILFNAYFIQFIGPISILGYVFKDTKKAILEMKGVLELFSTPLAIHDKKDAIRLLDNKFDIEFKNVSFKYQNQLILNNLSFKILSGEMAVINGPSGSGKSTILKLLLRSYEPTEGQILINGINIKNISLDFLRKIVGFVPQDSSLLDATICANIEFFNFQISLSNVKEAARKANISESIELFPHQYNTLVGERGIKLSGGEKQRIALARMFAKNPQICVLDEPTSSLDEKTGDLICKNIRTYLPHATKIIVSHRLTIINEADKVITLNSVDKKSIFSVRKSSTLNEKISLSYLGN